MQLVILGQLGEKLGSVDVDDTLWRIHGAIFANRSGVDIILEKEGYPASFIGFHDDQRFLSGSLNVGFINQKYQIGTNIHFGPGALKIGLNPLNPSDELKRSN